MTVLADVVDVALRVAGALEQVGAGYFVGGSFASSLDGEPRATNDIDFVIDLKVGKFVDFVAALGTDFEVDVDMLKDAVLHGRSANIFYLPLVMKIDFFGHAHGPYDDSEFDRRRPVVVREDRAIFVKSPEDTILRKLLWFRAGGEVSDRQGATSSACCAPNEMRSTPPTCATGRGTSGSRTCSSGPCWKLDRLRFGGGARNGSAVTRMSNRFAAASP